MTSVALQLVNLHKSFGSAHIIRDVNLSVNQSERHAIIGPNGAGKSTLFNLISGMFAPSAGEVRLFGEPISGRSPFEINRAGLARSFQITNVFPSLSVFENVRIGVMGRLGYRNSLFRAVRRLNQVNETTDRIIDEVRLTAARDKAAGSLAYSDQRSLEIAMTLSTEAKVILLDEPTAGMSTEETAYFIEMIRRISAGRTLMIVEHDMSVVFSLCDRISVLVYGNIIASGTPAEIRASRDVQNAYLGEELASVEAVS